VAGTTGITGAADSVWVLDTGKPPASAILHVTGRDIEAQEIALKFDMGFWSIMGEAREVLISEERREILSLVSKKGPISPKEIAEFLGKSRDAIRFLLIAMKRDGQLSSLEEGVYSIPPPHTPYSTNRAHTPHSPHRGEAVRGCEGETWGTPHSPSQGKIGSQSGLYGGL